MATTLSNPSITNDKHNIREWIDAERIPPTPSATYSKNYRKHTTKKLIGSSSTDNNDPITAVPYNNIDDDIAEYNDTNNTKPSNKRTRSSKSQHKLGKAKYTDAIPQPIIDPIITPDNPTTVSALLNSITTNIPGNAIEKEVVKAGDIRSFFCIRNNDNNTKSNSTQSNDTINHNSNTPVISDTITTSNTDATDNQRKPALPNSFVPKTADTPVTPVPSTSISHATPIRINTTVDTDVANVHHVRARRRTRADTDPDSANTHTSFRRKRANNHNVLNTSNSKSLPPQSSNYINNNGKQNNIDPSSAATTVLQPVELAKQQSNHCNSIPSPINLSDAVLGSKSNDTKLTNYTNDNSSIIQPTQRTTNHTDTSQTVQSNKSNITTSAQASDAPTQSTDSTSTPVTTTTIQSGDTDGNINIVQVIRRPNRSAVTNRPSSTRIAQSKAATTPFTSVSAKAVYDHPIHTTTLHRNSIANSTLPKFTASASTCTGQRAETQDDYSIQHLPPDILLSMICDGHGLFGQNSSLMCKSLLPCMLATQLTQTNNIIQSIQSSISSVHAVLCKMSLVEVSEFSKILSSQHADDLAARFDYGTTLIMCILQQRTLYVANVGDSRAIIFQRSNTSSKWSISYITVDHEPSDPLEAQRIIAAGGIIFEKIIGDKRITSPLMQRKNSVNMTRAIGHAVLGQNSIISSIPDISVFQINDAMDTLIIMGSDGLYDVVNNDDIIDIISTPSIDCEHITLTLTELADKNWKAKKGGDNVTCLAIHIPNKSSTTDAASSTTTNA